MKKEELLNDLMAFFESQCQKDPSLNFEITLAPQPLDWIAPTEVDRSLPIVQALVRAPGRVLGNCPPFAIYPAGTDAPKFQLEADIPTVPSYGPGMISVAHGPNEWVGLEIIIQASKIYALAAYDVLGSRESEASAT